MLYHSDFVNGANLWEIIRKELEFNFHILSFRQKCRALYSLIGKFPKKCSFTLRKKIIKNLIKQDFNGLSIEELMMFRTATRNEKKDDDCYRLYNINILKRKKQISQTDPDLGTPIDVLYTFYNCRLASRDRKLLTHKKEEEEEELEYWNVLSPMIYGRIPLLSVSGLMRMLSCLEMRKLELGNEFYYLIVKRFMEIKNEMAIDEYLHFVDAFSRLRHNSGIGDENIWNAIGKDIEAKMKEITEIDSDFILFRLFKNLNFQNQISESAFYKYYVKRISSFLTSSKNLNWNCLHELAAAIPLFENSFPKNKEIKKIIKEFTRCLCLQNHPSSYRQHYFLKMYRQLIETKYPEWDLSNMDISGYHAEIEYSPWKIKDMLLSLELKELISIIQVQDIDLTPLVCFENSFMIDLANEEFKYAVLLKTKENVTSSSKGFLEIDSSKGELRADKKIQKLILESKDWHVIEIDYDEFKLKKDQRATWLVEILKKGFEDAVQKAPNPAQLFIEEFLDQTLDASKEAFSIARNEKEQMRKEEYYKYLEDNKEEIRDPNFVQFVDDYAIGENEEDLVIEEIVKREED